MSQNNSGMEKLKQHYAEVAQESVCSKDASTHNTANSEAQYLYDGRMISCLPSSAQKASRGCGDPVSAAALMPGETVLDLGSGGGIDALIAASQVGSNGFVYGIDMTSEMVHLASKNALQAGADNVTFMRACVDEIPLPDSSVDVVISNCVINLCENKQAVFQESYRVLKPEGRLIVSDIVSFQPIPALAYDKLSALLGCTNGISSFKCYENMLSDIGFDLSHIETKTMYFRDVLLEKAKRKQRMKLFTEIENYEIDGITGSALISAYK